MDVSKLDHIVSHLSSDNQGGSSRVWIYFYVSTAIEKRIRRGDSHLWRRQSRVYIPLSPGTAGSSENLRVFTDSNFSR